MADREAYPAALAHRVDDGGEEGKLRARVFLRADFAGVVGHGKVREHALRHDAGEAAGLDDVLHTLVKVRTGAEKAEA